MHDQPWPDSGNCHCGPNPADRVDTLCGEGLTRYRQAVAKGCTPRKGVPRCVLRKGLLVPPPDDPDVLVPVAPEVAEAELIRPIEAALARQRLQLQSISDAFQPVHAIYTTAKREHQDWVTEIHGERVIGSTLGHALRSCRTELMAVEPGDDRLACDPADLDLLRGVRHRTLHRHSARTHAATLRHIDRTVAAGGEVRTLDQLVDRLVIVDREVAYLPGAEEHASVLEIRQPGLVAFLTRTFEDAWERATPLVTPHSRTVAPDITDEVERAIMRMLVAGHTDEAIARRLGTSRRTVAGRVSRLSAALGSRSRAQLGYLIATTGLLPLDDDPAERPPTPAPPSGDH